MHNQKKTKKQKTLLRLFKTVFQFYPVALPVVLICIIFSAVVSSMPVSYTHLDVYKRQSYSSRVAFAFQQGCQCMEYFCTPAQSFAEGGSTHWHNHKFLNIDIIGGMGTTI